MRKFSCLAQRLALCVGLLSAAPLSGVRLPAEDLSVVGLPAGGLPAGGLPAGGLPGERPVIEAKLSFVQLPKGAELIESIRADFNGDNLTDLLLAWQVTGSSDRFVQWHYQREVQPNDRKPAFQGEPERPAVRLDRSVLAIAFADVHPDDGPELVVFTASVVWVVRFNAAGEAKHERLFATSFLWQDVEASSVFSWQAGVRDLDGDGLVDFIVPEPTGYRVALQRRDDKGAAQFDRQFVLDLPPIPVKKLSQRIGRERGDNGFEISLSLGGRESGPLLKVVDRVPVLKTSDWDADGDLDMFCVHDNRLLVWLQTAEASFGKAPDIDVELPRERGRVDTTWRVMAVDVDHDGRVDIAIHSSRMVEEETRVSIEIYRNPGGDPFLDKKRADDRLRLKGLVGFAQYEDIDGDHLPEFVIGSMDLGLMDAMTGGSFRGVLNVFKNDFDQKRSRFRRPVALSHGVDIPTKDLGKRGNYKSRFFADVNGDGICDLLQRTEYKVVKVLKMERSGRGFALGAELYSLAIDSTADVETVALSGRKEFFVIEASQVIHVRFP